MKTRIEIRPIYLVCLILALILAACAPSAEAPESEATESGGAAPAAEATEGEDLGYEAPSAETGGAIVVDATDPCAIVTQEQVAAAFGKDVAEVNADTQGFGSGCEYSFDPETNTELQISIYEGDVAKTYFAGLAEALETSCEAFFDRVFDVAFSQSPTSEQDVSGIALTDLYTNYIGLSSECLFVQNEMRPDIGENVTTFETIFFSWGSNVAVLSEDRVVEFTYQEPIPDDVQTVLQSTTDKDSYYAAAQPYRDSFLAKYTEKLIILLQQATAQ